MLGHCPDGGVLWVIARSPECCYAVAKLFRLVAGGYLQAHAQVSMTFNLRFLFQCQSVGCFLFVIRLVEIINPVSISNIRPIIYKTRALRYRSYLQHELCEMNYVLNLILGFSPTNNALLPECGTVSCVILVFLCLIHSVMAFHAAGDGEIWRAVRIGTHQ